MTAIYHTLQESKAIYFKGEGGGTWALNKYVT